MIVAGQVATELWIAVNDDGCGVSSVEPDVVGGLLEQQRSADGIGSPHARVATGVEVLGGDVAVARADIERAELGEGDPCHQAGGWGVGTAELQCPGRALDA